MAGRPDGSVIGFEWVTFLRALNSFMPSNALACYVRNSIQRFAVL